MKNKKIFLLIVCLIMAALFGNNNVHADTVDDVNSIIGGIAMYKMSETGVGSLGEWADGAISDGAGIDSDSFAYALYKLGLADVSTYCDSLERYVSQNTVRSATTRLKYALCLCMKDRTHGYIAKTLEDSIGQLGIMSFVYGQHLANNGAVGQAYTPEQIALEILAMQHPDGGWSVMGQNGDVDVTAMVLQALSGIGAGDGSASGDNKGDSESAVTISRPASVEIAIERGVRFLSGKQNSDGGFSGFGNENSESTSQVLIALSSLGIDAATDSRFIKDGNSVIDGLMKYALPDGSFEHISGGGSDSTATSQAFTAFASYICFRSGEIYYLVGSPKTRSLVSIEALAVTSDDPLRTTSAASTEATPGADTKTTSGASTEFMPAADAGTTSAADGETSGASTETTPGADTKTMSGAGEEFMSGADTGTTSAADDETPAADAEITAAAQTREEAGDNIKIILLLCVLGLAIVSCVLLLVFKKRNPKNFLFVLIVAAVAATFVFFSDFKTENAYYTADNRVEKAVGEATITIRCDTIAGEGDSEFIPKDGIILDTTTYEFGEGDSVYDILVRAVRENKIHMEKKKTGSGPRDYYICGIANIYEYDWGDLSGWMYYVNGESPSVGCGAYTVEPGDRIEWLYTREIGRDIEESRAGN